MSKQKYSFLPLAARVLKCFRNSREPNVLKFIAILLTRIKTLRCLWVTIFRQEDKWRDQLNVFQEECCRIKGGKGKEHWGRAKAMQGDSDTSEIFFHWFCGLAYYNQGQPFSSRHWGDSSKCHSPQKLCGLPAASWLMQQDSQVFRAFRGRTLLAVMTWDKAWCHFTIERN